MNRSVPLKRTTGLSRSPWVRPVPAQGGAARNAATRRKPLRTVSVRPPGEFTAKVKLLVRKRAGDGYVIDACCEACGIRLGQYGGEIQHRAARGSGGCKDEVINGAANAVLLCGSGAFRTGCHGAAENREPYLGMGGHGFWIGHGTTPGYDPRNVPIRLHGGKSWWLTENGTYSARPPQEVAA